MKLHLRNLSVPLGAGALAWFLVPVSFWDVNRASVLTALSVIVAAVMVRLARGLPFTNADHYEISEIRQTTAAIKQVMRSLSALLSVALGTMLLMIFAGPALRQFSELIPSIALGADRSLSAIIAFLFVYVVFRILQVAKSDYNLVEMQARFIVRAVERRELSKIALPDPTQEPPMETKSYGRLLQ